MSRADWIRLICENPFVDGKRLEFADWIEENHSSTSEELKRAELIRLQCRDREIREKEALSDEICFSHECDLCKERIEIKKRVDEILKNADFGYKVYGNQIAKYYPDLDHFVPYESSEKNSFIYDRGFISEVWLECLSSLTLGIYSFEPITRVKISGKRPLALVYNYRWITLEESRSYSGSMRPDMAILPESIVKDLPYNEFGSIFEGIEILSNYLVNSARNCVGLPKINFDLYRTKWAFNASI